MLLLFFKLDYCNVHLYGLPDSTLRILQRFQNYICSSEHITHVLHDLHWLPVDMRIMYDVLLYTYKALREGAPPYTCAIIELYITRRSLRFRNRCTIDVPPKKYRAEEFRTC